MRAVCLAWITLELDNSIGQITLTLLNFIGQALEMGVLRNPSNRRIQFRFPANNAVNLNCLVGGA
jgi:hypothetical protein